MAKKSDNDPKKSTLARIKRTEAYAERVRVLFAATVNEILALNKTMPTLNEGEMFSFDNESLKKQREVESLLRQLHSAATMAIEKGIRLEWAQANAECDKLVQSCFGKRAVKNPEFGAWMKRNTAAMRAFIARSDAGMNLSDRVWQSTRQLRDEMEVAITCAIGEGSSAATLSRRVRKYLNDPDLMFRRFRYKDPDTGEWRRKWKKRVIDSESGKVSFIDYDKDSYSDQWTGRGYYKSSAQNAMRVARTETNIAYRRADHARWQQMDFVIGQRVHLSRSHPKPDICDKLAGDYPKDFVFDGWHPQCFCYVTPILVDEDLYDDIMNRDDWREQLQKYTSAHHIDDCPKNFHSWVADNSDRLAGAAKRGTTPYFIANNAKYTGTKWKQGKATASADPMPAPRQKTPLEIADERHARRTAEEAEKIQKTWSQRQLYGLLDALSDGKLPVQAQTTLDALSEHIFFGEYAEFNQKAAPLLSAVRRHAARTVKAAKLTQAAWDIRRIENLLSSIQNQDLKTYLEAHLPAAKAALKGGKPGLVIPLRAKIATATQESFMHTFATRGATMANQSPAFKEIYDRFCEAINNNDGITTCRLLPEMRTKAATLTRWNLRKWDCIDHTFTFEGIDADRVIYQGTTLTTSEGAKVTLTTLQQDLLKFKDKNGVTFYYTLGVEEGNIRYPALKASKLLESKPQYIRDNLKEGIIFTDRPHPLDKYYQKEYKGFTRGAMYSGDPVTVHSNYVGDDDDFNFCICHEIGHHIDLKIGWRRNAASQAAWKQAQTDDGKFYRAYGRNSPVEDFADMVSLYATLNDKDKVWYETQYPHRAAIIKKILAAL